MLRFTFQRLVMLLPTIVGITIAAFLMVHLVPGDPVLLMAGSEATEADIVQMRSQLGLDRPLHIQYISYMSDLSRGDMGRSIRSRRPVMQEVRAAFPNTFRLALLSIVASIAVGVPLGVVAAVRRNSVMDRVSMIGSLLGVSVPGFWLALMLMLVFSLWLGWLPASGASTWRHHVLPVATLAAASVAIIVRLTRTNLLEVLREDYVRTARSKGLRDDRVHYKHALKNALLPIVTFLGLQFGFLLGGAVVIETVFAWPGMGRLTVSAIFARDYPLLQGCVLTFAVMFSVINLVVDLAYAVIDPRIRYAEEAV